MKRQHSSAQGFSLVELVIVILLLGILAAVAVPVFFDLQSYRNRTAYDEIAGALRYAQKLAVASGCEVRVDLSSGNGYALQQHATGCTTGAFTTLADHPLTSASFPEVGLAASTARLTFDALGRCDRSATLTVGGRTISVIAETGYVDAP